MKFLPHSNGVQRLNIKRKLKPIEIVKEILLILGIILIVGFTYQRISNFIANEKLKPRVEYTRVDGNRFDYILKGEGEYTVIFDGALGTTLTQWDNITEQLEEKDIATFVYNRSGYGHSDGSKQLSPKEQAEQLKILLRKAAVPGPYIIVGEEYGSLVLSNFAKEYPEEIAGVVFIDPISEEYTKNKEFKRSLFMDKLRRKIEYLGSQVGITTLIDKLGMEVKLEKYRENLSEEQLEEFDTLRTKSDYTRAVYSELLNLYEANSNCQEAGMFRGKPFYALIKDGQESVEGLGEKEFTKIKKISNNKEYLSVNDSESIINAINTVIKEANDIARKNKK